MAGSLAFSLEVSPLASERERIPPGQTVTEGWPVLHEGPVPSFDPATWTLRVFGEVERPLVLSYEEFRRLPTRQVRCDIHCVTHWSKLDNVFEGVPFSEIARLAGVKPEARYVILHAENDYTTNVPLEDCLREHSLLAYRHNGADLTPEHGWPLRAVIPHLYFWKSAKWVRGIEFSSVDKPGYWEQRGYHNYGDPWREQRFWFD